MCCTLAGMTIVCITQFSKPKTLCHCRSISIIIQTPALIRRLWHCEHAPAMAFSLQRMRTTWFVQFIYSIHEVKLKMFKTECQQQKYVNLVYCLAGEADTLIGRAKRWKKKNPQPKCCHLSARCMCYLCICIRRHSNANSDNVQIAACARRGANETSNSSLNRPSKVRRQRRQFCIFDRCM